MAMKNAVEVVVDGRVYKISGYESQEYLHQIAVYINEKMTECHSTENYRKQSGDQRQLMLSMNLADDYFKAKNQAEKLTAELEKKERELYSVRHDLIEARLEIENLKKEKKAGSGQNNRRNEQHAGKQNNVGNNVNSVNRWKQYTEINGEGARRILAPFLWRRKHETSDRASGSGRFL